MIRSLEIGRSKAILNIEKFDLNLFELLSNLLIVFMPNHSKFNNSLILDEPDCFTSDGDFRVINRFFRNGEYL